MPDHEYTVPQTPTGTPQPLPTQPQAPQPVQPIGTQAIPAPDGGHYVYIPPQAPVHPSPQLGQTPPIPQAPDHSLIEDKNQQEISPEERESI